MLAIAALGLGACAHGYVSIGYDTSKTSRGGMSDYVTEKPATGSVGVGVGARTGGVELRLQTFDLDPAPAGDRFVAASSSLEMRLVPARIGPIDVFGHIGPSMGCVFDKQMLQATWGIGARGGVGADIVWHGVALWIDIAREELTFGGPVVAGRGDRDVVQVGVRIGG